ncbi:MAG: hypothetical protein K2Q20_12880, partial [Phycisphaerales bacterium]|nr:hypothetical protein [Phycisphaerales bacterium]
GCLTSGVNSVACNDNGGCATGSGLSAITSVPLQAGTPYIIRVARFSDFSPFLPFTLSVSPGPAGACCTADGQSCVVGSPSTCPSGRSFVAGQTCAPNRCPLPLPSNDACSGATVISSLPFTSQPVFIGSADDEPNLSCNPGAALLAGVWYTYTPPTDCVFYPRQTGTIVASIGIFAGTCGNLSELQCGTDSTSPGVALSAGTTYFVLVGQKGPVRPANSDRIVLQARCATRVSNDLCSAAVPLTLGTSQSGTLEGATPSPVASSTCGSGTRDAYFRFTAPSSGAYRASLSPTAATPLRLSVDRGCDAAFTGSLYCAGFTVRNGNTALSGPIELLAGQSLIIRVSGATDIDASTFTVRAEGVSAGACCALDGSCSLTLTDSECLLQDGLFQGLGTACLTSANCQPRSVCCFTTGVCVVATAAQCASAGGTSGSGTTCFPSPCGPAPTNISCSTPAQLTLNTWIVGNNTQAPSTFDFPDSDCQSPTSQALWYAFAPASSGAYTLTTCGSPSDTVVSVFTIDDCNDPFGYIEIACADDTCTGNEPTLVPLSVSLDEAATTDFNAIAGTTYLVRLSTYAFTTRPGGNFQIRVIANAPTLCCRGVTCAVIPAADCIAPAGVGIRTVTGGSCAGQSAVNSGCCYADFNKSGVKDVADIFAYLSAW